MEVTSVVSSQGGKMPFVPYLTYVMTSDALVLEITEFTTEVACCRFDVLNGLWTF
jgi:hypothetical protein